MLAGREDTLARLLAAHERAAQALRPGLVLLAGPAGMGKTAVLTELAARVERPAWGTCWSGDAPALWPWTQILGEELAGPDRLLLFDAIAARLRERELSLVILDDLQWADQSTLDLIRYLVGVSGSYLIVAAYRPDELTPALGTAAERIALDGLSVDEVASLIGPARAREIHDRTGGNPFFVRELARSGGVPDAVREVIAARVRHLSPECGRLLELAAVAGSAWPDVMADAAGITVSEASSLIAEAEGFLTGQFFTHDLYRESIYAGVADKASRHHEVARALAARHDRGGRVFAAEVARHFALAATVADPEQIVAWASLAAEADRQKFAHVEAADHLARAREALETSGHRVPVAELLTAEAQDRFRAGDALTARSLLTYAWERVSTSDDRALVALGMERLGARFAMPRHELVSMLETARGAGTTYEAQVTAALARQLSHSVPADRPQAAPLAAQAVAIARRLGDPAVLAECLLAEHDARWIPDHANAAARVVIGREISVIATEPERRADGLLLAASALLELGAPEFRVVLAEYDAAAAELHQPRYEYLRGTRQAALAILDGDAIEGERLCREAAELGRAVGDPDTGNVLMSQRLELTRIRNNADELRAFAVEAVQWWTGVPVHAHAVAAGFYARAGAKADARREFDLALSLGDWRTDRSYLWPVFMAELVTAAIALRDKEHCAQFLEALLPIADTCAVNGALVCFMGANAQRVGLLYRALGDEGKARHWLANARETHNRLGARAWGSTHPVFTRDGAVWRVEYRGMTAHVKHVKGLHDLAALVAKAGTEIPATELAGSLLVDPLYQPMRQEGGLTGYPRRNLAVTAAERSRKAVTARVREAIARVAEVHPELGRHLDRSIRTGNFCCYVPD